MRERHPELFSDSSLKTELIVTREVLSYHLETLTNQKDESTFEAFALRLCEKFISPNLRPQTGPIGGGDGKTDSETYPVSEVIAARWFVPDPAGAKERWAFAFSAMKDWKKKVRADVKSIVGTRRDFSRIYFVTNQFAPAKDSAALQDALEEKYGVPVTILDRTWLLDRIFKHHSMDIAVEVLGVGKGTEKESKQIGPKDFKRVADLEALDTAIADGSKYIDNPHALADDCLKTALLARSLERSRLEVEGRFERATRIANQYGLKRKELIAVYDWAWTAYFWFEDGAKLNALYDIVEGLAISSEDADDMERLTNLLPLLHTSVRTGVSIGKVGAILVTLEA